jgi:hypothetical protein
MLIFEGEILAALKMRQCVAGFEQGGYKGAK